MDSLRELTVHVDDETRTRESWRYARALAAPHQARLTALLAPSAQASGAYLAAETAALATQLAAEQLKILRRVGEELVADCPGAQLRIAEGDTLDALAQASLCTDLLVVSQHDPDGNDGGLEPGRAGQLLTRSAAPVLCVPHIGAPAGAPAQSVLLAWAGTRESARALRDALPLLQRARRVELVAALHSSDLDNEPQPPAWEAVQRHLRSHLEGRDVELLTGVLRSRSPSLGERLTRGWSPDATVAESLLSHAADSGADLLVMGAWGHSRAWELVLGGVTRSLLRSMTLPVLFSH